MGNLLMFEIFASPGELGTTSLGDTLQLWEAVLRPQVVQQVGLLHKLSLTVWLCAWEGLLPPVHIGQVSFELVLESKLLVALRTMERFDFLVYYRHVPIKVDILGKLLVAFRALDNGQVWLFDELQTGVVLGTPGTGVV